MHITKGKLRAARFAVPTDVGCKAPEQIINANCCCFIRLIRLLKGLRNCKVFNNNNNIRSPGIAIPTVTRKAHKLWD